MCGLDQQPLVITSMDESKSQTFDIVQIGKSDHNSLLLIFLGLQVVSTQANTRQGTFCGFRPT